MSGVKGRSGTNKGKDKPWSDALRLAINEFVDGADDKKIRRLAVALIDKGLAGDVQAIKEIGDRLEGKPVQATELSGPDGGDIPLPEPNDMELARKLAYLLTKPTARDDA